MQWAQSYPEEDLSGRGFLGLPQKGISIKTGRLSNAVGAQCRFIFEVDNGDESSGVLTIIYIFDTISYCSQTMSAMQATKSIKTTSEPWRCPQEPEGLSR